MKNTNITCKSIFKINLKIPLNRGFDFKSAYNEKFNTRNSTLNSEYLHSGLLSGASYISCISVTQVTGNHKSRTALFLSILKNKLSPILTFNLFQRVIHVSLYIFSDRDVISPGYILCLSDLYLNICA